MVAGAVGDFPSVLDSHLLGAALGGLEPVDSFGSEEDDGSASISTCGTKVSDLGHTEYPNKTQRLYLALAGSSSVVRCVGTGKGAHGKIPNSGV